MSIMGSDDKLRKRFGLGPDEAIPVNNKMTLRLWMKLVTLQDAYDELKFRMDGLDK